MKIFNHFFGNKKQSGISGGNKGQPITDQGTHDKNLIFDASSGYSGKEPQKSRMIDYTVTPLLISFKRWETGILLQPNEVLSNVNLSGISILQDKVILMAILFCKNLKRDNHCPSFLSKRDY